jgi:hypothetical protein
MARDKEKDRDPRNGLFCVRARFFADDEAFSSLSSDETEIERDPVCIDESSLGSLAVQAPTSTSTENQAQQQESEPEHSSLLRNQANDLLFDYSSYEPISDDEDSDSDGFESNKNKYKWCVCENGSNGSNPTPKMCERCNQWYHLVCLPSSYRERHTASDFVCPVCNAEDTFIQKYSSSIRLRKSLYKVISSSNESESESRELCSKGKHSSDSENSSVKAKQPKANPRHLTEEQTRQKINILKSKNAPESKAKLIESSRTKPKRSFKRNISMHQVSSKKSAISQLTVSHSRQSLPSQAKPLEASQRWVIWSFVIEN